MENTQVGGNKQIAAHNEQNKRSSNNRKKIPFNKKVKRNPSNHPVRNAQKNQPNINKSLDDLEKKMEAKLESSLGLNSADAKAKKKKADAPAKVVKKQPVAEKAPEVAEDAAKKTAAKKTAAKKTAAKKTAAKKTAAKKTAADKEA